MYAVVSVIIPVYNVGEFLARGLDSVLTQTYKDFELLLIDDGSTDNSGQICDEYAKKDTRIKVFHKPNGGVSSARNLGLDNAVGKYIYMMDPDDYIEPTLLNDTVAAGEESGADMIVFGLYHQRMDKPSYIAERIPALSGCLTRDEAFSQFESFWIEPYSVCTRVFRRDYIERDHARFKPATIAQDCIFCMNLYCTHFEKMYYIRKPYYHYIMHRPNSSTNRYHSDYFESNYEATRAIERFVRASGYINTEKGKKFIARHYIRIPLICMQNQTRHSIGMKHAQKHKELVDWLNKPEIKAAEPVVTLDQFSRREAVLVWMLRINWLNMALFTQSMYTTFSKIKMKIFSVLRIS